MKCAGRFPTTDRSTFPFPPPLASFVLPEGCFLSLKQKRSKFHSFVFTNLMGARFYGYAVILNRLLPKEYLSVLKLVFGAQIYTQTAYSEFEQIPGEIFVENCLILISGHPMHRFWEETMISFTNSLVGSQESLSGVFLLNVCL